VAEWFHPGVAFVLLVTSMPAIGYWAWLRYFAWRPQVSVSDPEMVSPAHARIMVRIRNSAPHPILVGPAILQCPEGASLSTCPCSPLDADTFLPADLGELRTSASMHIALFVAVAPWFWTTPESRCLRLKLYVRSGGARPRISWYNISRVLPG
jgi:hypothetical protein